MLRHVASGRQTAAIAVRRGVKREARLKPLRLYRRSNPRSVKAGGIVSTRMPDASRAGRSPSPEVTTRHNRTKQHTVHPLSSLNLLRRLFFSPTTTVWRLTTQTDPFCHLGP